MAAREKITYRMGPPPKLIRREGEMFLANPNWICVEGSEPEKIVQGCFSFSQLGGHEDPQEHDVALARHHSGLYGLFFSPQLSPFVFANLVSWIGDQGIVEGVSGACGWTRAGREGLRYQFSIDSQNKSEDTLLAYSNRQDRVEVYLPDGSCCPTSKVVRSIAEPSLTSESVELVRNFRVVLDASRTGANAAFIYTHELDQNWKDTWC